MASMLPAASGMTITSGQAGDQTLPRSEDRYSGAVDQNLGSGRQPTTPADASGKRQTNQAAGEKREGQDSCEDYESAKPARTRSKSSSLADTAAQPSAAELPQPLPQFAAIFADALSSALPPVQPSIQSAPQPQSAAADTAVAASATTQPSGLQSVAAAQRSAAQPKAKIIPIGEAAATVAAAVVVGQDSSSANTPQAPSARSAATKIQVFDASAQAASSSSLTSASAILRPAIEAPRAVNAGKTAPAEAKPVKLSIDTSTNLAEKADDEKAAPASITKSGFSAAPTTLLQQAVAVLQSSTAANPQSAAHPVLSVQAATAEAANVSAPLDSRTLASQVGAPSGGDRFAVKSASKMPLFGAVTLQHLQGVPDAAIAETSKKSASEAPTGSESGADSPEKSASSDPAHPARQGSAVSPIAKDGASDAVATQQAAPAPTPQNGPLAASGDNVAVAQSGMQERIDAARQLAARISAAGASMSTVAGAAAIHKLTVDVSPQHWGRMQITLTQSPATAENPAQATATIVTESESARQALLGQVKDLHASLQASGMKIDKIDIVAAPNAPEAATADSAITSVAGASAGSLSNNAQQQPQSHQPHSHSTPRFEFAGGSGSAGADASGGQGSRERFAGFASDDAGAGAVSISGLSAQTSVERKESAAGLASNAGVNVLA